LKLQSRNADNISSIFHFCRQSYVLSWFLVKSEGQFHIIEMEVTDVLLYWRNCCLPSQRVVWKWQRWLWELT